MIKITFISFKIELKYNGILQYLEIIYNLTKLLIKYLNHFLPYMQIKIFMIFKNVHKSFDIKY